MKHFEKDNFIIRAGSPFDSFYVIAEGCVEALYHSPELPKTFTLKKGDVIGIFDFGFKEHSFTYRALETTHAIPYELADFDELDFLLKDHMDLRHFLANSMIKNVTEVIDYYKILRDREQKLYNYLQASYHNYQKLCKSLALPVKILPGTDKIQPFVFHHDSPDKWLPDYYESLQAALADHNPLLTHPPLIMGLLARSCRDIHQLMFGCQDMQEYVDELSPLLLNESSLDLFDLYTDLQLRAKSEGKDTKLLEEYIVYMESSLKKQHFVSETLIEKRVAEYNDSRERNSLAPGVHEDLSQIEAKLAHSVELILDYADVMDATRQEFIDYIESYRKLPDKNSLDKEADNIRRQLTRIFNLLYAQVFQIAVRDSSLPIVIRMFLNFGFVDTQLAGLDNAAYLYSIARNFKGDSRHGIYTLYEWIMAIYKGNKQPSRNDMSQDYDSYVRNLRHQGKIDQITEQRMSEDTMGKVMYELENMFPTVNKITQGHLSTFCPIFIEEHVMKGLETVLVTPYRLTEAINKVVAVDFSAFYHPYLYSDDRLGLHETFQMVVQPDIILMPNVGSGGTCWQEIEGMRRTTPGRMMISAFHLENLEKTLVSLIGDFRWEFCRRVQGLRWNDVSDHSLTSDYYDYVMFYQKNRALSAEAKEKIKLSLTRARNNFKTMFVMDYSNWILYESKGSVKLNKVVRQIMADYVPFPAQICETLGSNGAYTDAMQHYITKKRQQLHRLEQLVQKCQSHGTPVPDALEAQIQLLNK